MMVLQTEQPKSQTHMRKSILPLSKQSTRRIEAVNAGIRNATGLYFKVVDSDDWVNKEAYEKILQTLEELIRGPKTVDLLISNFVYEKQGATRKKVMQYRHCLPQNEIFGWDAVKHMPKGKYLLMHSKV